MRAERPLKQAEVGKNIKKSGLVNTSQSGVHPHLEKYVRRHLSTAWSQPLHQPTIEAYRMLVNEAVFSEGRAFILDSGCGTGKSTQNLAVLFPEHNVIGVDRSLARLARGGLRESFSRSGNCIMLRAELTTLWRLLLKDGHSPDKHFLFYPNPWPKPGHLLRRWHAHPVFPQLLSLGGDMEMRCNWEIYALEFAQAVKIVSGYSPDVNTIKPETGISLFEQKYLARGHSLYSVSVSSFAAAV